MICFIYRDPASIKEVKNPTVSQSGSLDLTWHLNYNMGIIAWVLTSNQQYKACFLYIPHYVNTNRETLTSQIVTIGITNKQ